MPKVQPASALNFALDFPFIFAVEFFRVSALRGLAVDCSGLEVDFAVDFYVENSQLTRVCSDDVNFAGVSQILNGFAQMIGPQVAECAATQTISAPHLLAQQQLARNPRKMANSALLGMSRPWP
jgi:hypothetical protein